MSFRDISRSRGYVIPAEAGIYYDIGLIDSRLRGNDISDGVIQA